MPIEIGPVQLIVFGFDRPKFGGGIAAELKRLKEQGSIRVIDALVVHKNAEGDVRTIQITDLDAEETEKLGAIIGALIGLGLGGDDFIEPGAEAGMKVMSERGGHVFDPESWDVLEDIPNDSAAALLLVEHRWAIPLRDAIWAEGGTAVGDIWIHPQDLVAVGLLAAESLEQGKRDAA
jgi:hypothetical protein